MHLANCHMKRKQCVLMQKRWCSQLAHQMNGFSHLAIEVPGEEISNEWCEPVTDATYKLLK